MEGVQWIRKNNEGHSATLGGPMFNITDIASAVLTFQGISLLPRLPESPVTLLPPVGSILRAQFDPKMRDFDEAAWIRLGVQQDLPDQPPPAPLQQLFPANFEIKQAPSLKDKEFLAATQELGARWRLVFGRSEPNADPTGPPVVVPAKLGLLAEILKLTSMSLAIHKLQEAVRSGLIKVRESTHYLDSLVTLRPEVINEPFVRALRSCIVVTTAINQDPDQLTSAVSMPAFCTPNTQSVQFKEIVTATNDTIRVDVATNLLSEKSSAAISKKSEVYVGGDVSSVDAARVAYANFRFLFGTCALVDKEDYFRSDLDRALLSLEGALFSPDGKSWTTRFGKNQEVALNVLVNFQEILTVFSRLSTVPEYVTAVLDGQPIGAQPYAHATTVAKYVVDSLLAVITRGTAGDYTRWPLIAEWLPQVTVPKGVDDTASPAGAKPATNPPSSKRAKTEAHSSSRR